MAAPVLFDLDGVLADSRVPITRCVNQALIDLGYGARAAEDIEVIIGPPTEIGFGWLLGIPPESRQVAEVVTAYRKIYETGLKETPPYPGIAEAVAEIGATRRLAVATSKPLQYATPVLEAIGLSDAFEVVAGPRPGGSQAKSAMIAEAVAGLGEPAAAMVGDRRYDMEAAREHGLFAVGATWGFGSVEELTQAGADVLVDRPEDLLSALG